MPRYVYNGPIMSFNVCIASNWKGETYAPSEAKARNNLAYQFKSRITGLQEQIFLFLANCQKHIKGDVQ